MSELRKEDRSSVPAASRRADEGVEGRGRTEERLVVGLGDLRGTHRYSDTEERRGGRNEDRPYRSNGTGNRVDRPTVLWRAGRGTVRPVSTGYHGRRGPSVTRTSRKRTETEPEAERGGVVERTQGSNG